MLAVLEYSNHRLVKISRDNEWLNEWMKLACFVICRLMRESHRYCIAVELSFTLCKSFFLFLGRDSHLPLASVVKWGSTTYPSELLLIFITLLTMQFHYTLDSQFGFVQMFRVPQGKRKTKLSWAWSFLIRINVSVCLRIVKPHRVHSRWNLNQNYWTHRFESTFTGETTKSVASQQWFRNQKLTVTH